MTERPPDVPPQRLAERPSDNASDNTSDPPVENLPEISGLRARANRLRWWWQRRVGWMGGLAGLLLIASAVLAGWVRPAITASQLELSRARSVRLEARARLHQAAGSAPRNPHDTLRATLPPLDQRGASVARLLMLLEHAEVAVDSADYAAEEQEPGLVRVRANLPLKGHYGATRKLVADLLNELPHAALDALELARDGEFGEVLNGRLRLSLFFRREAP